MTISIPTVHSNGTAAADLMAQVREANVAVKAALEKLVAAAPHGRDYYVQNNGAYAIAQSQHATRCAALRNMSKELEAIWIGVANQQQ